MLVDMNRNIYIYHVRNQISNDIQIVADILGLKTDANVMVEWLSKMDMRNHGMDHQNGKVLKRYPILKNGNFSHFMYYIYWSVETNTSLLSREHIYVSPAKFVWITSGLCCKSEAERKKHHKSKRTAIISIIYPDK